MLIHYSGRLYRNNYRECFNVTPFCSLYHFDDLAAGEKIQDALLFEFTNPVLFC